MMSPFYLPSLCLKLWEGEWIHISVLAKDPSQALDDVQLSLRLILDGLTFDETELERRSGDSGHTNVVWGASCYFLVPVTSSSFFVAVDNIGAEEARPEFGGLVEVDCAQIVASVADRSELRYFLIEPKGLHGEETKFELCFAAFLSTSNFNKGPSPQSVLNIVKNLDEAGIAQLLLRIVSSDTEFVKPCLGLLYAAYKVVSKLEGTDKNKSWCFGMLANIHLARYDFFLNIMGEEWHDYSMHHIYTKGLKAANLMLEYALRISADNYEKRPWLYLSLSMCLQRLLVDLIQSEDSHLFTATATRFWEVIQLVQNDEPKKALLSKFAAIVLRRRFEITRSITDLDSCISASDNAIDLTNDKDSDKVELLNDLISALLDRYELTEDNQLIVVDKALKLSRTVFSLITDAHDELTRLIAQHNLARSLFLHQQCSGFISSESLSEVITEYDEILRLLPTSQVATRAIWLKEIALILLQSFQQSQNLQHLNRSISTIEEAKILFLNNTIGSVESMKILSRSLFARFYIGTDICDLEKGIEVLDDIAALEIQYKTVADTTQYLEKMFDEYVLYFGSFVGVEDVIKAAHVLDGLIEDKDFNASTNLRLQSLGRFLSLRLKSLSGIAIIPGSVLSVLLKVSKHFPPDSPQTGLWTNMTGSLLIQNFDTTRTKSDIDSAVDFFDSISQRNNTNNARLDMKITNSLAISLLKRFQWYGDLSDINRAIDILDDALLACPDGDHEYKNLLLNNFASSSLERFNKLGDITDFNNAAIAYQRAVDSSANASQCASITYNFGHLLLRRLHALGSIDDADRALSIFQDSMDNAPEGSAEKNESAIARSRALLHRFWHLQDSQDVNQAISLLDGILHSTENTLSQGLRAELLHCLGDAYSQRFAKFGDIKDIDKSIGHYQNAIDITPDTHPSKSMLLFDLGRWLPTRYDRLHDKNDLENSHRALLTASEMTTSSPKWRFRAASLRGYWSQMFEYGDAMSSYRLAMELIPDLAWLGLPIANRRIQLLEVGGVVSDAVAAAISAQRLDLALEWFEQGRSVIWTQLNILRTPSEELFQKYPDLAVKYNELTKTLREMEWGDGSEKNFCSDQNWQSERSRNEYHNVAQRRESCISGIRKLDGFQDFLRPKGIFDILPSSRDGTIVVINASTFRSDALILLPNSNEVVNVQLDTFTLSDAYQLKTKLQGLLQDRNALRSAKRPLRRSPFARRPKGDPELEFRDILATLWKNVSEPILNRIATAISGINTGGKDLQRIWWCLSGPLAFLPIHASGLYPPDDPPQTKLSNFAVSSYIPCLSILAQTLKRSKRPKGTPRLLQIALPIEANLPFTEDEMAVLQKYKPPFHIESLLELKASAENVKSGMETCGWVHFACHGVQDSNKPENSALLLANKSRLTLAEITRLELPDAQFAFLSACQTATGDDLLPEEAVHLAAGMLSAGYRSVIGTMWSIPDEESPQVADMFYRNLCTNHSSPDPTKAAEALHSAIVELCRSTERKSFFSWVPFTHYGG